MHVYILTYEFWDDHEILDIYETLEKAEKGKIHYSVKSDSVPFPYRYEQLHIEKRKVI